MKLSKRLNQIYGLVTKPYDDIWDCCCDHGLLGFKLLSNNAANTIHFVDRVQPIINNVENKLLNYFSNNHTQQQNETRIPWQVHTLDMLSQPLPIKHKNKQLIIIAGIGGDLLITLINKIITDHKSKNLEFIICPVHHEYELREVLIGHSMSLINEKIVFENKRFYQVLHVMHSPDSLSISPVDNQLTLAGSIQWNFSNEAHQQYHQKLLTHYKAKLLGTKNISKIKSLKAIIRAYEQLPTNL